ncbi:PRSS12 [Mytilus coruscus]|uniref:PRSS12 n=1 Tax=Mytilus coruscus TaxID=42192 RepID=A0A6J8ANI4_MYTCO|nr:PRSS12 [Mytilus coruscus]
MFLLVVLCINLSSFLTFAQEDGDLRLISGRLEVFHSRVWGTVCDDYFNDIDAQVACRQLGHNSGISLGKTVDDGTGMIWLDDIKCTGNESTLAGCPHKGWGVENCNHIEDVGIECLDLNEGDIRLTLGRLEILYYGIWGTVCDDNFDDIDAQVACRQLGYK